MKIADAKAIPIDDFLENLGHTCTKEVGGRKWYKRPYGNERTASFVLSADRHAWYDHGEGVGGNILDLAIKYADLDGISEALKYIENTVGSGYTIPTIRQELKPVQTEPYYTLVDQTEFQVYSGRALSKQAQYLNSRGIDSKEAAPYLRSIRYTSKEGKKVYSALAIPNVSGGMEGRRVGDWEKVAIGHKDVSAFYADRENAPWHCFYSMIDFCTFLTIDKPPIGAYNYLIINSDSMVGHAADGKKPEIIGHAERFLETIPPGTMIHYPHDDSWKNGVKIDLPIEKNSGLRAFHRMLDYSDNLGWSGGDRYHLYEGFKDWTEAREKQLGLDRKTVTTPTNAPAYKP